jgi:ribosome maturation factor RimP
MKMDLQSRLTQLRQVILPILEEGAFELVEMNFITPGKRPTLRLLVDRREGGISLGDCARLNTKIGEMLDENNLLQDRYILEVSSPGLDRPLKNPGDYARCTNRKVRFFLNETIKGKIEIEGEIEELTGNSVFVQTEDGRLEIPLAKVARAKQVIE